MSVVQVRHHAIKQYINMNIFQKIFKKKTNKKVECGVFSRKEKSGRDIKISILLFYAHCLRLRKLTIFILNSHTFLAVAER